MNNRRTKHLLKILFTQLGIGFVMFSLGLSLVFYAEGYRLYLPGFRMYKTGIVYVAPDNKMDARVFIGNQLVSKKIPFSKNLSPGEYDLQIRKDGWQTWQSRVEINPELVSAFRTIILFKTKPSVSRLTDDSKIKLLNAPIDALATTSNRQLSYQGYEIWINDQLVTRFSQPVLKAIWYPDFSHIVYQQGNEIRIIETVGTNDSLLATLSQNTPTRFVLSRTGNELYFIDNDEYYVATIR